MRRLAVSMLLLAACGKHVSKECRDFVAEIRAMSERGEGLAPFENPYAQIWRFGHQNVHAPEVDGGYEEKIDAVTEVVVLLGRNEIELHKPDGTLKQSLGGDFAKLREEMNKMQEGDRVAILIDERQPAAVVASVVSGIPKTTAVGLVVRKRGATLAAAHQKAYAFSPSDLEPVLAKAFEEVRSRGSFFTTHAYQQEIERIRGVCPAAVYPFRLAAEGKGVGVVMPALADAILDCGCDKLDARRTASLLLFWVWPATTTHALLPLPHDYVIEDRETVADLARVTAKPAPAPASAPSK